MRKIRMEKFGIMALMGVISLSMVLASMSLSVAVTQPVMIVVEKISGNVPSSPNDPAWIGVKGVDIPMSSQIIAKPRWYNTTVKDLRVKALHNGQEIAFLISWRDQSRNDKFIKAESFRDAVAIQLSVEKTDLPDKPYFCMGQEDQVVNIWHWKADWQNDAGGQKMWDMEDEYPGMFADNYIGEVGGKTFITHTYTGARDEGLFNNPGAAVGNIFSDGALRRSPVEDLNAGGFGTLTTQAKQNVDGNGVWGNNIWNVLFKRPLKTNDGNDAEIAGKNVPVAFAVWDGDNGERNGQKSVSTWYYLALK